MILVTGANGLLGSHLVRQLIDSGESVRGLRRTNSDLSLLENYTARIEWAEGDITDIFSLDEAMKGISKVYHTAAFISMQARDVDQMLNVNATGTANVVNAALSSDIDKLLYVSSVAAFGRPDVKGRLIDENLDIKDSKDNFGYFKSKLYAEREVWRGIAEGLNAVIINPSTIIGGGFWATPPNALFEQVYEGMPFYATGINGFVDVRDVVDVAIRLMNSDITAEKFIVSAGNISWGELTYLAADAMKVKRPYIKVTKSIGLLALAWDVIRMLFNGAKPLATRDSLTIARTDFKYSNGKIRQALNFQFRPLKDTIAETAALYLRSVHDKKRYGIL